MTHEHPITLPPEVLQQLRSKAPAEGWFRDAWIAEQAAKWGADQELEACCEWLGQKVLLQHQSDVVPALRDARRPKPLSLKEQSITLIDRIQAAKEAWDISELETIRRALEQLPDNE